jgi:hypothetical protein
LLSELAGALRQRWLAQATTDAACFGCAFYMLARPP